MKRVLPFAIASAVLAVLAAGSPAARSNGPFYLVPSPTKECEHVKNCVAVTGPLVVVPAHGEATFLFGCPTRRGYLIGGTDARASSSRVQVWFDGQLGAPIGSPPSTGKQGAVLLFHAVANNAKLSWFQPVLGCVALAAKSKRSTLAVLPGTAPGAPLDLRVILFTIFPGPSRSIPTSSLSCLRNEKLVGHWTALAFARTGQAPDLSYASAVSINAIDLGNTVQSTIRTTRSMPQAEVQVGATCEP